MTSIKYISIVVVVVIMTACSKDNFSLYSGTSRIQFGPEPSRIYSASFNLADTFKNFTFFYEPDNVVQDTAFFDIYAIGGIASKDRYFTLEQEVVPGANNATPGISYKAFNDPSLKEVYKIAAGQVHLKLPVIMFREPALKTGSRTLKFRLAFSEDFMLGEESNLWRRLEFVDRLSQPRAWSASISQYYLGEYSEVKHKFFIDSTGLKWDQDFMAIITSDLSLIRFWQGQLRTFVVNYNNAHPGDPLKDEFRNPIEIP